MSETTLLDTYQNRAKAKKSDRTAQSYTNQLSSFIDWLEENRGREIWEVDELDYEDFCMELLDRGHSISSPMKLDGALDFFFSEWEKLSRRHGFEGVEKPDNPTESVHPGSWTEWKGAKTKKQKNLKERDEYHSISPEKVEQIAENVRAPTLRNELIVRLLYQTGLRRNELTNVEVDDIDCENREIRVDNAKNDNFRTVTYAPSLEFLMSQWLDGGYRASVVNSDSSPYLFPTAKSEQIRAKTINTVVTDAAKDAGIQSVLYKTAPSNKYPDGQVRYSVTAHTLRHSYAVSCLNPDIGEGPIDIRNLQQLMGHDSIEQTEKYLGNTDYVRAGHEHGPG